MLANTDISVTQIAHRFGVSAATVHISGDSGVGPTGGSVIIDIFVSHLKAPHIMPPGWFSRIVMGSR
jgi:hypothetical protein